jgi:hypothetical protein
MRAVKRCLAALLATAVMLGLGGCAGLTAQEVAQIEEGKPALILAFKKSSNTVADLTVVNLHSGTRYTLSMSDVDGFFWPGFIPVETGRYRVIHGSSDYVNATTTLPLLSFWFKDFDVGRGEIVDLGTFSFEVIEAYSQANPLETVSNALFKFDPRHLDHYVTYSVDDSQESRVLSVLAEKYPTLIGKRVKRPLQVVLNKERFQEIVAVSHKPRQDGSLPTTEEARKRMEELLGALMTESSAKE